MSVAISSKRYAQAIFQIARDRNQLEEWQGYLAKIAGLLQNEQFIAVLENPKLYFEQKTRLFDVLLGKIDPLALNFSYLLVLKNKFKHIGEIAEQYEQLVDELRGIKRAKITTSILLDDIEQQILTKQLEQITASKLKSDFLVDDHILGGFVARVDGTLMDGSIKHKLMELRKNIGSITK